MKKIYFIVLAIIIIFYIIGSVRKNNLSIKTSFEWICASVFILVLSIVPKSIDLLAKVFGISYPPALFLTLCVIFLLIQNFNLGKKLSNLNEKCMYLEQEISILKAKNKRR